MAIDGEWDPHTSSDPLLEARPDFAGAPPGYTWYILRGQTEVVEGRASGISVGADKPGNAFPDLLYWILDSDEDHVVARPPRYPGEPSHVLLSKSFRPSAHLAQLKAGEAHIRLPDPKLVQPPRFRRDAARTDVPDGFVAYTIVFPGVVCDGIFDHVRGDQGSFGFGGSGLTKRPSSYDGEPSHILIPSEIEIPKNLLDDRE
jgi:hypothetical protein